MKKITDRERLDWLEKHEDVLVIGREYQVGRLTLRQAIDAEIKAELRRRKGRTENERRT